MLPYVIHSTNKDPLILEEGMVFTIEPIICQNKQDYVIWDDGWTNATKDYGLSAQVEHTILVTSNGVEILT